MNWSKTTEHGGSRITWKCGETFVSLDLHKLHLHDTNFTATVIWKQCAEFCDWVEHRIDGPAFYHFECGPDAAIWLSKLDRPTKIDLKPWANPRTVCWYLFGYRICAERCSNTPDMRIGMNMLIKYVRETRNFEPVKEMALALGFDPYPIFVMEQLSALA